MLIFALAIVAAASPRSNTEWPATLGEPEVAAARVAACGFKTARPRFDDILQEDVVEVRDVSSASEEELRCAALASIASSYYVVFSGGVEQAYEPLYWRLSEEHGRAAARVWLKKRGLLARLPAFEAGMDDARNAPAHARQGHLQAGRFRDADQAWILERKAGRRDADVSPQRLSGFRLSSGVRRERACRAAAALGLRSLKKSRSATVTQKSPVPPASWILREPSHHLK
jgi:hypothetical protein